jgi:arylsulfatase A-like enzyme
MSVIALTLTLSRRRERRLLGTRNITDTRERRPFGTRKIFCAPERGLAELLRGLFFLLACCTPAMCADQRPNILVIVADDLGFSDLGCYGGEIETPNLDSLATSGVRLTQFYTMGRCCPSRASILTGQYPHRVGLGHMTQDIGLPGYRGRVSENAQTIAEVLRPAGYRSFLAGKWHLGTSDPTDHGFEEFYGTLVSAKRYFDPQHLIRRPEGRKTRSYPDGQFYATDAITDHAITFLEQARETPERPWFLYLAHFAPHFPLHAPRPEIDKYADRFLDGWDSLRAERLAQMKSLGIVPESTMLSARSKYWNYGETESGRNPAWDSLSTERRQDLARRMAIYAAMIDRMDQQIGRVLGNLKEQGEFKNTLILFLSDNGACAEWDPRGFDGKSSNHNVLHRGDALESMGGEDTFHSIGSGWANAANTPWRLYKHFSYEGGTNSPCIVHWPERLSQQAGSIHRTPTHVIDVLPTCIAASGSQYSGVLPLPGLSIVDQLTGKTIVARPLFFEHEGHRAVRDGRWKLVALKNEPWELFDFSEARTEQVSVADKHPETVLRLERLWNAWAKENFVTPLPTDLKVDYLK